MVRRLHRDPHRVCIYEEATPGRAYAPNTLPAAITNPWANLDKVYWHSDLPYQEEVYDRTLTITLPATSTVGGWQDRRAKYFFPNHNLGFIPDGVLVVGNSQIPTGEPIQGATNSARIVGLGLSATQCWISEFLSGAVSAVSLPSMTVTFRVILIRTAPTSAALKMLLESTTRVYYGRGKFDTDRNYLKGGSTAPEWWMAGGRTIDTTNAGYRSVRPNGTFKEVGTYTGSFTGSGFVGIDA